MALPDAERPPRKKIDFFSKNEVCEPIWISKEAVFDLVTEPQERYEVRRGTDEWAIYACPAVFTGTFRRGILQTGIAVM